MADVCWNQSRLFSLRMPQDMPLEGNKAGENFYWKFAIKVAEEELLSQSDSQNSQPMCSQVYTSSKICQAYVRPVCLLPHYLQIVFTWFSIFSGKDFLSRSLFRNFRSKFFENHAKRTYIIYAKYSRRILRAGNRVWKETLRLQCTKIVYVHSSYCSDSGNYESFWQF